jgi:hypothetical protein
VKAQNSQTPVRHANLTEKENMPAGLKPPAKSSPKWHDDWETFAMQF